MKQKKTIVTIVLFFFGLGGLHAQENSTSSGGVATGTGGTASYSIGQVFHTTSNGTNGSNSQGVQQPYEIYQTLGINEEAFNLTLKVFPNPINNYLILKTDNNNLSYKLLDLQGKIIKSNIISVEYNLIKTEELSNTTYFLQVLKNNQLVKTFKIIKK